MSLRLPSNMMPAGASGDAPAPAAANPGATPDAGANAAPLLPTAADGGFFTESDSEAKRGLSGMAVLLIVVGAAGAVLLAMRQLGLGPSLNFADIKIDYPLEGPGVGPGGDHLRILTDLKSSHEVAQVPLEDVQMNPFEWKAIKPVETVKAEQAAVDEAELSRRELEAHQKRLDSALAKLKLNSVLAGRVPVARISGEMVRVGDVVGELFTVTAITGRSVELAAGERVFTLTLGDPAAR